MRKASSGAAQDDLTDIIAQFPQVMQEFDHLKCQELAEIPVSDILRVHRAYKALLDDLFRWPSCTDISGDFRYQPSAILDPEVDQHVLSLVPQTRRYRRMFDAKVNTTYFTAQLVLHLEILQLCQYTQKWQSCETSQLKEAVHLTTTLDYVLSPSSLMQTAGRYCNAIVESVEQHLLPSSGVLAAGSVVFPIMAVMGFLASQSDPRVEYLLTLTKRYEKHSGYPLHTLATSAMAR